MNVPGFSSPHGEDDGDDDERPVNPLGPTIDPDIVVPGAVTVVPADTIRLGYPYYTHGRLLKYLKEKPILKLNEEPTTIGRDYQKSELDILLVDESISRHQADISINNKVFYIHNKSSTISFQVDGFDVKPNMKVELWNRSRIRFNKLQCGQRFGLNYVEFICDIKILREAVENYRVEIYCDGNAPLHRGVRKYALSRAPWARKYQDKDQFERPYHVNQQVIEQRRAEGRPWDNSDIDLIPRNPMNDHQTRPPLKPKVDEEPYLYDFETEPPPRDTHEDPFFPQSQQQWEYHARLAEERRQAKVDFLAGTQPRPNHSMQNVFQGAASEASAPYNDPNVVESWMRASMPYVGGPSYCPTTSGTIPSLMADLSIDTSVSSQAMARETEHRSRIPGILMNPQPQLPTGLHIRSQYRPVIATNSTNPSSFTYRQDPSRVNQYHQQPFPHPSHRQSSPAQINQQTSGTSNYQEKQTVVAYQQLRPAHQQASALRPSHQQTAPYPSAVHSNQQTMSSSTQRTQASPAGVNTTRPLLSGIDDHFTNPRQADPPMIALHPPQRQISRDSALSSMEQRGRTDSQTSSGTVSDREAITNPNCPMRAETDPETHQKGVDKM